MKDEKIILGIETSCDDTSLSLIKGCVGANAPIPTLLGLVSFSQEKLLEKWGGVVPEIAARNHLEKLDPLLKTLLDESGISLQEVNEIAVTSGPGLMGPLLTGINLAKTISLIHHVPINPVNHLFAHLEAIHLTERISYPYLGILVSGGHSIFFLVSSPTSFTIIGKTLDDAAGEAFDKGAKLMQLGYPGGRVIDEMSVRGNSERFDFPIGLKTSNDANLSFSGVKTHLRNVIEKNPELIKHNSQDFFDLCASYQHAIISALLLKLKFALKSIPNHQALPIVVGGGVACNSHLRRQLKEKYKTTVFVAPKYCTDNAAMVANYALRTYEKVLNYPESLAFDAKDSFFETKNA